MQRFFALFFLLSACETPDTPLDADTKQRIDSLIAVRSRETRIEVDTLCQRSRKTEIPRLVDSIMQVRRREIEESLRGVGK